VAHSLKWRYSGAGTAAPALRGLSVGQGAEERPSRFLGPPAVHALHAILSHYSVEHDHPVTSTYGEVDRSRDPERAADWQERIDAWPAIQAYKRYTFELLRGQSSVLDIGCGPVVTRPRSEGSGRLRSIARG
jgi:hypothetical protein